MNHKLSIQNTLMLCKIGCFPMAYVTAGIFLNNKNLKIFLKNYAIKNQYTYSKIFVG